MRSLRAIVLACLCGAAGTAYGQGLEVSLSAGAGVFKDKGLGDLAVGDVLRQSLKLENGVRISVRMDINSWKFFGHELTYGYNHTNLVFGDQGKTGMNIHQFSYDFLVHALPEGSSVRPFLCGGGGFSAFFPPGTSAFSGNGVNKFGFNYGGGVKVKLGPIYGFRFDMRDYVTGKPFDQKFGVFNTRGLLHNIETSVGIAIFF